MLPVHTASFWNITIQWTSHDDFTEFFLCLSFLNTNWKNSWNQSVKKVTQMIWQNFSVLALKNVSKTFKSIWKPNPCMDPLEKKNLLYQNLLYFLQGKSFSPWMACFNSYFNDLRFFSKGKSKLVKIVNNFHGEKDLPCKKIE